LVILASGCSLQKKSVSSKIVESNSAEVKTTLSDQSVFTIDTSKTSNKEIVYSKTEYYPPAENSGTATATQNDKDVKGAVKSVETYTVREKSDTKGQSKIENNIRKDSAAVVKNDVISETVQKTKPAPDPHRWMWIFGILVICAGTFIYVKRSKVFPWIKSVLFPAGKNKKI
jgi:hypothetical protein